MTQFIDALLGLYTEPVRETGDATAPRGQGLVEYALILAFIAILVIVALVFFGERLTFIYSKIGNSIPT